jgi:GYF domain 2
MSASPVPNFDLSTDPEIQAGLEELRQAVQAMQVEMEERQREIEANAVAPSSEEAPAAPQIDPDRRAEFERFEAELGLPIVQQELQHQPDFSTQKIIQAVETVAGAVQDWPHRRPSEAEPQSRKELQWFYVRDLNRVGPVNQSQLLNLLERGELHWDALVWNKKLSDWTKASETELIDFSEGPPPPPLPSLTPAAKNQPKEQKCKACDRVNGPDDRFCAGCGKPLRSTRK